MQSKLRAIGTKSSLKHKKSVQPLTVNSVKGERVSSDPTEARTCSTGFNPRAEISEITKFQKNLKKSHSISNTGIIISIPLDVVVNPFRTAGVASHLGGKQLRL